MGGLLTDLLKPRTWRAGRAFFRAIGAYHKKDYGTALVELDKSMEAEQLRTDVNMAFRTILLTLNGRSNEERRDLYMRIAAGEFRADRKASKYARAYADYWLGYVTGRQDIVPLWSKAYAAKPSEGFAARYLPLPESPIVSDVLKSE
jgi:hypothetical protein